MKRCYAVKTKKKKNIDTDDDQKQALKKVDGQPSWQNNKTSAWIVQLHAALHDDDLPDP